MLNQCYHKSRKLSYQKKLTTEIPVNKNSGPMFLTTNHSNPDGSVINKELKNVIEAALNKLPEDYRMTLSIAENCGIIEYHYIKRKSKAEPRKNYVAERNRKNLFCR